MPITHCAICGSEIDRLAERCATCGESSLNGRTPGAQLGAALDQAGSNLRLLHCYECGQTASVLARACPTCGAPLQVQLTPASPHPQQLPARPRGGRRTRVLQPAFAPSTSAG